MHFSKSLYFSSNELNRLLNNMADEAFKPFGLTSSYAFLLMIVNGESGIQPMKLSKKLQLTPSTITRLVEKMEYQGYLERRSEGRATHINPTEEGKALQQNLNIAWQKMERGYTDLLGERYTEVLAEMTLKAAGQIKEN